jgi:diaminopimelate decarboxylase
MSESAAVSLPPEILNRYVESFLSRKEIYLRAARDNGTPLYIFEPEVLRRRAVRFSDAFAAVVPEVRAFYAVKSNNHPEVARTLAAAGLDLDVSSGEELKLALAAGAAEIVFSGPGKTEAELSLAAGHRDQVTVLLDSFGELERLDRIAGGNSPVRCGVRLTTDERALWAKFGIPFSALPDFFRAAENFPNVRLRGCQFHTSWNLGPENHLACLKKLGRVLEGLEERFREEIEFVDIGGGFWPEEGEWLHRPDGGQVNPDNRVRDPLEHFYRPAVSIGAFAKPIGAAFRSEILTRTGARLCLEPGRWICHPALQIILKVEDKKSADLVITDGGTNAVGWERYEFDYFPVINLTRPGLIEFPCRVLGSLCTPHDVWGYSCHGQDILPGDLLLVPNQGAYTYSLRQEFIKPLPRVVFL